MVWDYASINPTVVGTGAKSIVELSSGIADETLGRMTVERIIGRWAVRDEVAANEGGMTAAIYVESQDAFAGGATLEPETDLGQYLWMDSIWSLRNVITGDSQAYTQHVVDIRVKRKIRAQENLLMWTVESVGTGGGNMRYVFDLRILYGIH